MVETTAQILGHILLGIEFIAALVALYYLPRLKHTFWKWFCIYLIVIFIQEVYWYFSDSFMFLSKQYYYGFIGVPMQILFLIWLFVKKSLKQNGLFYLFSGIYSVVLLLEIFLINLNITYSLSFAVGTILLTICVVMELKKQIRTDNILKYKENRMFYITIGLILFYIATFPFFVFYDELLLDPYKYIGNVYYIYFKASACLLYLLFIASLIWGKQPSK